MSDKIKEQNSKNREKLREKCLKEFGGDDAKPVIDEEKKVKQLFCSFMNKETGRIGFEEAKVYQKITEEEDMELPLDIWTFVCKYAVGKDEKGNFKTYDPHKGLTFLEFRKTFLDKKTAQLLETNLDNDYNAFVNFVRRGEMTKKARDDDDDDDGASDQIKKLVIN